MSFKLTNYILTPKDLIRGIFYLTGKAKLKDYIGVIILALIFVFMKNYLGWQIGSVMMFIFPISMIIWNIDSKTSITFALIFLILVFVFFIMSGNPMFYIFEIWAKDAANWVYYFLIIGIFKQAWDFVLKTRKENKKKSGNEPGNAPPASYDKSDEKIEFADSPYVLDLRNQ